MDDYDDVFDGAFEHTVTRCNLCVLKDLKARYEDIAEVTIVPEPTSGCPKAMRVMCGKRSIALLCEVPDKRAC